MEAIFLLASHQILEQSTFLQKTLRLRSDGFVFLYPILLIFLFVTGWMQSLQSHRQTEGLQSMYLSLTIFLNVILAFLINYLIKAFVDRPRPYESLDLPTPTEELALSNIPTDSFPSDHAAVSMTIAATLILWGYQTRNRGLQTMGRGFFLIALIMGRGRIAIAIHWPTDILAGFIIGITVALLTSKKEVQKTIHPVYRKLISLREKIISTITPIKEKTQD